MRGSAVFRTGVAPGGALAPRWTQNVLWRSAKAVPSLDLRFAESKSLTDAASGQSLVTFTRASSGTYVGSDGALKTATTNEPRFDHNPTTGESLGLLVEEQRTNSIRNNTMVGAVAGTPGTLPTNWTLGGAAGLTTSVVGTGTQNGISYVDLRLVGTSTGTFTTILFEPSTQVAATNAQAWAISSYIGLVGGSLTGSSVALTINQINSAGSLLAQLIGSDIASSVNSSLTRFSFTSTTNQATIAYVRPLVSVNYNSGVTIDITLRIGLPQLEQGAFATSVIPTTGTAATRSADVASITGTNFSSWYRQDEGTVFADASSYMGAAAVSRGVLSIDGSAGDVHRLFRQSDFQPVAQTLVTSVTQAAFGLGATWTTSASQKIAYAYAANNFGVSTNGGAAQTDNAGTIPTTNTLNIGNLSTVSQFGGTLRRIAFWPQRLANTTLQQITQ